ncbi:ATP-binding cassette domain-containing protein [Methanobacterium sp. BAmetb5]|jgi:ABC-type lipoprotein export system ATPase subunit|uniref:ATP-binding cassette domain-containing protein n=1 Tax=Methanobacterium sp. BAmetb5 TaxID=2025351 RepID=UPI000E813985|nr:ATP-binding cassette domain-containing protein [Methanobacterium sp. BAmetb5]AXV39630.1 MAG: ABC transporter ATP-binding protein [Methanobacterium sp. BAmetb5]
MIEEITIMGGFDKQENPEPVKKVVIKRGEIFGVVGPTGSGKSSLIGDIEQLSQEDSFSRRKILVNGEEPSYEDRTNPRKKMVAQLSQNMNFLADMTVGEFLSLHAKCRGASSKCVNAVIELANTLTGEPIKKDHDLTILSGGQSRALMVADVAIISNSPIVLIDEIENAGIRKHDALEALAGHGKIVMVVTHDPVLALMTDKRIVMKNGGMQNVVSTSEEEKTISQKLNKIDELMLSLRDKVRNGEVIQDINMGDLES